MTSIRDKAIWQATKGENIDLVSADAKTKTLPEVKTNYKPSNKMAIQNIYMEKMRLTK